MNKNILKAFGLCLFALATVEARMFNTPYVFNNGYPYAHYPFDRPINGCWSVRGWWAGLHRDACRAFTDDHGTDKESLAGPWFNKTKFKGIEVFAADVADSLPCGLGVNPLLTVADIEPRFNWSENSAYFGLVAERQFGCDCEWRVGVRANMPYKTIRVGLDDLDVQELDDFVKEQREVICNVAGATPPHAISDPVSFAYRLDFLSALFLTANPGETCNGTALINNAQKFVRYNDTAPFVQMAGDQIDVTVLTTLTQRPPITVIKRTNGTAPCAPFGVVQATALASPDLAANGSNGSNNDRLKFANQSYQALGNDVDAQAQLWVVPTYDDALPGTNNMLQAARTIQQSFDAVVKGVNESPLDLFNANKISFASQCRMGVGDMWSELYVRRDWCNFFAEGIFGVKWPTGKRWEDPENLLHFPTGNNRHFEAKLGLMGGYNTCDWFAVKVDGFYSWALKRSEKVAASFVGATVKNIGPTVDADVSWGYFVGDVDFTFLIPCIDLCIGADLGYQFYAKQKDDVSFKTTTAKDLFGTSKMLDSTNIENRTKVIAHKVKTEIFYQDCNWHLYGGFWHTFAGKNAPNDTDWYLGAQVYFS